MVDGFDKHGDQIGFWYEYSSCPSCRAKARAKCRRSDGVTKTRPCHDRLKIREPEHTCLAVHQLPRGVYVWCGVNRGRAHVIHSAVDAKTGEMVSWS